MMMRNRIKEQVRFPWLKAIAMILVSSAAGLLLLTAVFSVGGGRALENAQRSVAVFEREGLYYRLFDDSGSSTDNFSDGIMFNIAANIAGEETYTPLQRAIDPYRVLTPEGDGLASALAYFSQPYETEGRALVFYGRYWHGYIVVLRTLLMFFSYSEIRFLNVIAQLVLFAAALLAVHRRIGLRAALTLLLAFVAINPAVVGWSLVMGCCYYPAMLGVIGVCYLPKRNPSAAALFFVLLGVVTAYLDLLTYPIFVFCLPLLMYVMLLQKRREADTFEMLCAIVRLGIAWAFGYLGMWGSKWLILALGGRENTLAETLGALAQRSSNTDGSGETISRIQALGHTFEVYGVFRWVLLVPAAAAGAASLLHLKQARAEQADPLPCVLGCLVVALIPVAWMLVTANHAYIHYVFTYRNWSLSFAAVFAAAACNWGILHHTKP